MKKIIFLLIFVAATASCFSQTTGNTAPVIEKNYLQKSKNQKTAAWILLGGGAVINIIAFATFPKDYVFIDLWGNSNSPSTESRANTSGWLSVVGTASMLASIPFFISARVNKKRAVSVSIDTQQLHQLNNS